MPPVPASDGASTWGTFVPAVLTLTAPTGLGVAAARVKFWYAEQGVERYPPRTAHRAGRRA